ncbi:hypothetical protein [Variovorax ginsengisoli]|uniref:Uncharacterized protein n=1 Tax=Variovorax ginsengisoli TaxID=363844 RepID=A0ABT8SKB9_9BURK|nr:hypothetical protein [Variovorax ginsengisoli]MDN8618856.1 hypothetical protein [Variovorax ginsengisoli]MDO1538026.1 hypothetical protein [Variovorax ginsengisoli]
MNAVESLAETPPAQFTAFGSLIDLVRLRVGASSAEVCDACNTINLGSARYCKCCSHKLAGFYVAKELGTVAASQWDELAVPRRASALDLVAFFVVINSLVILTSWIPVG